MVGLYLNPPEHALVLSVDEKSQIQALDRSQPGLPLKKGRAGTMTHDFKRHGTTTLFAAFNVLDGKVIGECLRPLPTGDSKSALVFEDCRQVPDMTMSLCVALRSHPPSMNSVASQSSSLG